MVKVGHFGIEILQSGEAVREYEDKAVKPTRQKATEYVEIREGQPFSIKFTIDSDYDLDELDDYDGLDVSVSVDGHCAGVEVVHTEEISEHDGDYARVIERFWKKSQGRDVLQQLQFREAELREYRS